MNIASYLQERQYGDLSRHKVLKQKPAEKYVEDQVAETFINKPCSVSGSCRSTFIMEFSPDATKVASSHGDHTVRVTDVHTGECLHTLTGHPRTPWSLAYHPSSNHILASGCLAGQVRIWDLYGGGCEIWQTEASIVIAALTFHPTEHVLVIAAGNSLYFWDWSKPEPFAKSSTRNEYERVRWVRFDHLGHSLYTGISNHVLATRCDESRTSTNTSSSTSSARCGPSTSVPSGAVTSVYSNIVGCFQDMCRDRLMNQASTASLAVSNTSLDSQPSTTMADMDLYPGIPDGDIVNPGSLSTLPRQPISLTSRDPQHNPHRVRQNELLMASYANRLSQRSQNLTARANRLLQISNSINRDDRGQGQTQHDLSLTNRLMTLSRGDVDLTSIASTNDMLVNTSGSDLLNPNSDPFLPSSHNVGDESGVITDSWALGAEAGVDGGTGIVGLPPVPPLPPLPLSLQRVLSPQPVPPVSSDFNDNLLSGVRDNVSVRATETLPNIWQRIDATEGTSSDAAYYRLLELDTERQRQHDAEINSAEQLSEETVERQRLNNEASDLGLDLTHFESWSNDRLRNFIHQSHWNTLDEQLDSNSASGSGNSSSAKGNTLSHSGSTKTACDSREIIVSEMPTGTVNSHGNDSNLTSNDDNGIRPLCVSRTVTTSDTNMSSTSLNVPSSPLLTRFLKSQGNETSVSSSTCAKKETVKLNLRERLRQANEDLKTSSSSSCIKSTSTLTTVSSGIPQVTVISASDIVSRSTSLLNTFPSLSTVNVASSSVSQSPASVTVCSAIPNSVVRSLSPEQQYNVQDFQSSASHVGQSNPHVNQSLADIMNNYSQHASTVVASTSSHSSLFENIFHNSSLGMPMSDLRPSSRGRSRPSSYRSQPYSWQARPRYGGSSLMGPYLESRGINVSSADNTYTSSSYSNTPVTQASEPDNWLDIMRASHYNINGRNRDITSMLPPSHSRDQASSDTESELNSHLSESGAYFVPITADSSRVISSLSTRSASSSERNSDPGFLRLSSNSQNSTDSTTGQSSRSNSAALQGSQGQTQGQDLELVMDQNENYTTQRPNANLTINNPVTNPLSEIRLGNHDSNNNSIHIVQPDNSQNQNTVRTSVVRPNQDFASLRNNFVTMTDQIEREMGDLNRRINALRESFNQSLVTLRQDRVSYDQLGSHLLSETATNLPVVTGDVTTEEGRVPPVITVTQLQADQSGISGIPGDDTDPSSVSQPPTLLETSLRSHTRGRNRTDPTPRELLDEPTPSHNWRHLHRHYLHPHYSTSILDDAINRPNNAIQSAINRAIAGAFMGTGESAVANNIINQTHRIQYWDFTKCDIPDITSSILNVIVPHCKLHNSASVDVAQNSQLLATFVPGHQGFPDDNILTVYSLHPATRGQCLYTKSFGPNAISISISPNNSHILVGLAAKRLSWVLTSSQMVAQIYKLDRLNAGEKSMKHVKDVMHTCTLGVRYHVSGNSARWLPRPGTGLIYGTNRGDLNICKPGVKVIVNKMSVSDPEFTVENLGNEGGIRRCLLRRLPWSLNYNPLHRVSTSTQTAGVRRTAGTQTDETDELEPELENAIV